MRGEKPSSRSEYFGKSYSELQAESRKARRETTAKSKALKGEKKEYKGLKGEYSKTKQGNFMKIHPLDRI